MLHKILLMSASCLLVVYCMILPKTTYAAQKFIFPIIGSASFKNDYNSDRSSGKHRAIDIIASKHQPIVSATDGTIEYVTYPEPDWGYAIIVRSIDNQCIWYLHLNDDDKGTNNGKGGGMKAYGIDIKTGNPVKKGQLLGWVGDSGHANGVSHLHFSLHNLTESRCATGHEHDNEPVNPYSKLKDAYANNRISKPIDYPALPNELLPFNTWYRYKLNIARGNLTDTSTDEIIVGTGYGQKPKIRVFNSSKQQIDGFYPSTTSATYGVDVAVGDVDGDGTNEIIAGYRTVSSPKIAIFKKTQDAPLNFSKIEEFTAFEGNTSPRVAAGDINGDGKDEIIAAKGRGSSPAVRTFDENGQTLKTSFVLPRDFKGGLDVASADVADTDNDEIIVSVLTDGSSFIRVFDADFNKVAGKGFYAYGSSYRGGVYISAGNVIATNPKAEILTVPNGSHPHLRYFNVVGDILRSAYFLEEWWEGSYDIAASNTGNNGYSAAAGGNRRGTIR